MTTRFRAPAALYFLFAAFLALSPISPSVASGDEESLPKPSGPVVLTVTGAIAKTNAPGKAEFDVAMLEALGVETLTTTTSWTDGRQRFEGVRVSQVLDAVGAEGTVVEATALNDYAAEIPVELFKDFPVLFALRQNGATLTVRDKGPVWIVFPRDDYPELNDPRIDIRWVWQLKSIEVR
jgi:hypothetical protein